MELVGGMPGLIIARSILKGTVISCGVINWAPRETNSCVVGFALLRGFSSLIQQGISFSRASFVAAMPERPKPQIKTDCGKGLEEGIDRGLVSRFIRIVHYICGVYKFQLDLNPNSKTSG